MLDPAILKDNLEVLESNISRRNLDIDVNHLISLNEERKSLRFNAEQKRSQQKELGKQIANAVFGQGTRDVKIHKNLIAQDVTSLSDKTLKKNYYLYT